MPLSKGHRNQLAANVQRIVRTQESLRSLGTSLMLSGRMDASNAVRDALGKLDEVNKLLIPLWTGAESEVPA